MSKSEENQRITQHREIQKQLSAQGKLGPVARLMPTTAATTVRVKDDEMLVLDGPFAETKEQLVGFYCFEAESLEEALQIAKQFPHGSGAIEVRPVNGFYPGDRR